MDRRGRLRAGPGAATYVLRRWCWSNPDGYGGRARRGPEGWHAYRRRGAGWLSVRRVARDDAWRPGWSGPMGHRVSTTRVGARVLLATVSEPCLRRGARARCARDG